MKFINNIVGKYGADKLLHFISCGWLVSVCCYFGMQGMWFGIITAVLLSALKELLDEKIDWADFSAGVSGTVVAAAVYLIISLIK